MPSFQGFFLRDMQSGTTTVIAKTGDIVDGRKIENFVYWNFSGRVPGMGHGGSERDGCRGNWLAVSVSMLVPSAEVTAAAGGEESEEETGWAGIYAAHFLDDELIAY